MFALRSTSRENYSDLTSLFRNQIKTKYATSGSFLKGVFMMIHDKESCHPIYIKRKWATFWYISGHDVEAFNRLLSQLVQRPLNSTNTLTVKYRKAEVLTIKKASLKFDAQETEISFDKIVVLGLNWLETESRLLTLHVYDSRFVPKVLKAIFKNYCVKIEASTVIYGDIRDFRNPAIWDQFHQVVPRLMAELIDVAQQMLESETFTKANVLQDIFFQVMFYSIIPEQCYIRKGEFRVPGTWNVFREIISFYSIGSKFDTLPRL